MALVDDIERIAATVRWGDRPAVGILAAEPAAGCRVYVCAFEGTAGARSWIVVDEDASAVPDRRRVNEAVAIAALCEIAGDHAFPGDLDELLTHLARLRLEESPPGIEEAEAAALELRRILGTPPNLASPARLDAIGTAARRLEIALDAARPSPFAAAMQVAQASVEELVRAVEGAYLVPLSDGSFGP